MFNRAVFPKDWECFKERLGEQLGGLDLMAVTEADFAAGAPLHELGLQLQLWASFRWASGGRGGEVRQGTIRLVVT